MQVAVVEKHPLSIRWNHWINFPLILIMVWSGLCIYWANPVHLLPQKWVERVGLDFKLAQGLSWHWPVAYIFAANGICYFIFLIVSGHWRYIVPKPIDFKNALLVAAHDMHLIRTAPPIDKKYNSAQKLAYFTVGILGAVMVLTGFAIYKPTQLELLVQLLGGYEIARAIHFYSTIILILFFLVHVGQVVLAGWNQFRAMITGIEKVENGDS
jgi:thiosulfate reductase cytochrome b subunit